MKQSLKLITLVVRDYDEAIAFYTQKLGFTLLEDTQREDKRWVRVQPPGSEGPALLLARATTPEQLAVVGNQTGGRVFLFLETGDFEGDYELLKSRGVNFIRSPTRHDYGTVAVFEDLYGNKFDLIEPRKH